VVISGPTASGKSALAISLANKYQGVIINADSMQVYKDIPIITAQPCYDDYLQTPHALYGILSADKICSAGVYMELAKEQIELAIDNNQLPILVGGTGLYIKSLIYGIAKIPDIDSDLRLSARELYMEIGAEKFYQNLQELDPIAASKLNILDKQRVIRAYEVVKQTGISIIEWQKQNYTIGFDHEQFIQIGLLPERSMLYRNCDLRFKEMIEQGVIEEIEKLNNITMDDSLPVRKAHGILEITAYLNKEISLDQAIIKSQQMTRNYAKRQYTWLKHQMPEMIKFEYITPQEILEKCQNYIAGKLSNLR
jgi:tRNA dimethylallyltransferase